jgi:hypothetical protein
MDGTFKAREIIEEESFGIEKERISKSAKRLDDVLFGIIWVLSRKPESFPQVTGLDLYLAKTDDIPGSPALNVWFTFDDQQVRLLFIEFATDSE